MVPSTSPLATPAVLESQLMGYLTISGHIYRVTYIADSPDLIEEAQRVDHLAQAEMLLKSILSESADLMQVAVSAESIKVDGQDFDINKPIQAQLIELATQKGSYEIQTGTTLKVAAFFINRLFAHNPEEDLAHFVVEAMQRERGAALELSESTAPSSSSTITMPLPYRKKDAIET